MYVTFPYINLVNRLARHDPNLGNKVLFIFNLIIIDLLCNFANLTTFILFLTDLSALCRRINLNELRTEHILAIWPKHYLQGEVTLEQNTGTEHFGKSPVR